MLDKDVAREVTGYERGTITPFGSTTAWPVIADIDLTGDPARRISLGAGAHGVAATLNAEAALAALHAQVADDPHQETAIRSRLFLLVLGAYLLCVGIYLMITTDDSVLRGLAVLQIIAAVLMFRQARRTPVTRDRDRDDRDSASHSTSNSAE